MTPQAALFNKATMSNPPLLAVYKKMLALREFLIVSANDVMQSTQMLETNPKSQFWRRVTIRSFAAHVEGLVYLMKTLCLDLQPVLNVSFTGKELDRLREFSLETNEAGDIVQKPLFLKFLCNFKLAYVCYARALHSPFKLKFDGGYDCFREMVKIRDRLMHPKSPADLEVCDEEITNVSKAWAWYQRQTALLMEDTKTAFQEYEKRISVKPL